MDQSALTLSKPDHREIKFTPCGQCRGGFVTVSPTGWQRRKDLDGRDVDGYVTDSGVEYFHTPKGTPLVMATPCNCYRTAHGLPLRTDLPEPSKVVAAEPEQDIDALGWLRKK